MKPRNHMQW